MKIKLVPTVAIELASKKKGSPLTSAVVIFFYVAEKQVMIFSVKHNLKILVQYLKRYVCSVL